jgi:hypothetical protein
LFGSVLYGQAARGWHPLAWLLGLLVLSNWLLRRDDQVGCALFGVIDVGEAGAPAVGRRPSLAVMDVALLLAPRCPNAAAARSVLTACLRRWGLDLQVRERVGDYSSPTILVDGVDVMTARCGAPLGRACRLDLPTAARVIAVLRHRPASSSFGDAAPSTLGRSHPSVERWRRHYGPEGRSSST